MPIKPPQKCTLLKSIKDGHSFIWRMHISFISCIHYTINARLWSMCLIDQENGSFAFQMSCFACDLHHLVYKCFPITNQHLCHAYGQQLYTFETLSQFIELFQRKRIWQVCVRQFIHWFKKFVRLQKFLPHQRSMHASRTKCFKSK